MRKLVTTLIFAISLTLMFSCNFNTPKPPISYAKDNTWKGVFQGFWTGMNNNYVFWNLDSPTNEWDKVYEAYIGKFEQLGEVDYADQVATKSAITMLMESVKDISDGHFTMQLPTPKAFFSFSPREYQIIRQHHPELSDTQLMDYCYYHLSSQEAFDNYYNLFPEELIMEDMKQRLTTIFNFTPPTEADKPAYWSSDNLKERLPDDIKATTKATATLPDSIDRTTLDSYFKEWMIIDTKLEDDYMPILLGLTNGNTSGIPDNCIYLGFTSFNFTKALQKQQADIMALLELFGQYKQRDDTTGLIFDVRSNYGGFNIDRQLLFSDLLSETYQFGWTIQKTGDNRLDYSPMLTMTVPPYKPDASEPNYHPSHLFNKPVVALTNINSISNAEMTAMFVQTLPKGVSIGSTTHGAQGSLQTDNNIGNAGQFSVGSYITLVYTPYKQTFAMDGTSYEGKGIPATIEIPFNKQEFESGTDGRLMAAFKYVNDNQ